VLTGSHFLLKLKDGRPAAQTVGRYLFHLMAGQPLREKAAEQFFREKIAKQ